MARFEGVIGTDSVSTIEKMGGIITKIKNIKWHFKFRTAAKSIEKQ